MSGERILVVDDEPDIRRLVQEILEDEGYRIDTAENASEARKKVAANPPDLVLLDIWMPDTDGITLLKEWSAGIGLDPSSYGIESLRRTRSTYILKQTGDLEALAALLGLTDARSTARYLSGSGQSDALEVSRMYEF